jgi:hypothetical protein
MAGCHDEAVMEMARARALVMQKGNVVSTERARLE